MLKFLQPVVNQKREVWTEIVNSKLLLILYVPRKIRLIIPNDLYWTRYILSKDIRNLNVFLDLCSQ